MGSDTNNKKIKHPIFKKVRKKKTLGVGEGQGSLECYSPWGHKESDMTE